LIGRATTFERTPKSPEDRIQGHYAPRT
jgi:hypothetical protein